MKVFNTLTKKKEELKSINDKEIKCILVDQLFIIMHILEI